MLIDIMNDHGLEQLVHFLLYKKEARCILYSRLFKVSFRNFTPRTNSVILILFLELWKLSFQEKYFNGYSDTRYKRTLTDYIFYSEFGEETHSVIKN